MAIFYAQLQWCLTLTCVVHIKTEWWKTILIKYWCLQPLTELIRDKTQANLERQNTRT